MPNVNPIRLVKLLLQAGLVSATALGAEDWNTWLGPQEDNTVHSRRGFEADLEKWNVSWSANVGRGYSAITTFGNRAYTNGHDEASNETIVCLDLRSGKTVWEHSLEAELMPRAHGGGPNASIVIEAVRLYAISKDGQLRCLDPETGKLIWNQDLRELLEIEVPTWGFGASPVLFGDHLIVSAGKVAAIDKTNGDPVWISESDRRASYGTPVPFHLGPETYFASMDGSGFAILSANGREITRKRMVTKNNVVSNTPLVFENGKRIFIHTNAFSEVLTFNGEGLELIWNDRKLQNSQSAAVIVDNVLYGLNGLPENGRTKLYSRNPTTGETYWSTPNFGFGSLIAVDDTLLILTDDGELVTAIAAPDAYREVSRKKILEPTCWTKPIFANERILVRNDAGQVVCLARD